MIRSSYYEPTAQWAPRKPRANRHRQLIRQSNHSNVKHCVTRASLIVPKRFFDLSHDLPDYYIGDSTIRTSRTWVDELIDDQWSRKSPFHQINKGRSACAEISLTDHLQLRSSNPIGCVISSVISSVPNWNELSKKPFRQQIVQSKKSQRGIGESGVSGVWWRVLRRISRVQTLPSMNVSWGRMKNFIY